jgi:hypothetical protein
VFHVKQPEEPATEPPAVVRCAADPEIETALRCSRCDTPICPKCLVMTPVGARCRTCARLRAHPVYDVRPTHYVRAAAAGLGTALLGGVVVQFIPFFNIIALMLLGWLTGEAVSAAANRKRGLGLAILAGIATVVGVVGGQALVIVASLPAFLPVGSRLAAALPAAVGGLFGLWGLFVILAVVLAISRVR